MDDEEEFFIKNERFRQKKEVVSMNVIVELKTDSLWFPSQGSESCIRLIDIDGDGLDDILVALTGVTAITNEIKKDKNRPKYCHSLKVEEPCSGTVYGIRGYDFNILWSFPVKQSIFEFFCDEIDINNDDYQDCIGAGREATLVAFDPRNGKSFWDNKKIKSRRSLWNFYNPLLLLIDVDDDNMNDILISHGGNPTIPSYVHEREAGFLIIISSRTGEQIGEPFWMPDGKETYMSPVLYNNSTILFGTGGETVSGGLYSISIDNLLKQENQYVTIMKSLEKGIMVPPIILDIDQDGIDDILVSCFDSSLELIDGKTMRSLWKRVFKGFEFYTTPAPGDFNSDSLVDFMIILNYGEWDRYHYNEMIIIDGLTGETLWKKNNRYGEFTSPLTLQMKTNNKYQDSFIYQQHSQTMEGIDSNSSSILLHGIGFQDGEITKNESFITFNSTSSCDSFTLNDSIITIFLTNIEETRFIAVLYPPINPENHLCSNFEPMERSGNAIGNVNADGIFDIITITMFITKVTSYDLNHFIAHSILTRFSLDLNKINEQIIGYYQTDIFNKTKDENLFKNKMFSSSKMISNYKNFSIISKQTWNEYLGRYGNNHYYRN